MNWATFWAAAQAVVTGLAFLALLWQLHKMQQQIQVTRDTAGYDLLFRLNERFESRGMLVKRAVCAKALRTALELSPGEALRDAFWKTAADNVRAVLNEFELIGFLVKQKVINATAIWTLFGYWVVNYHAYCERTGFLKWERESPTDWEDFVALYHGVQAIARERDGEEDEADEEFLEGEQALGS